MRRLLTLGLLTLAACGRGSATAADAWPDPTAGADVVLVVPGMT